MSDVAPSELFHRLTIGSMHNSLAAIGDVLRKAEGHAAERKIEPSVLLASRLYPDMFPLIKQLHYILYLPLEFARHFTEDPVPKVGYDEQTFEAVHQSLAAAMSYLDGIDAAAMNENAARIVPVFFNPERGMPAGAYAAHMMVPDFFFHLTVAYAILRHNGVPLGKNDYIGHLDLTDLP